MTRSEFKAWFDGFSDNISDAPTKDQWKKIKKRVSDIDDNPVTERVFIDRYTRDSLGYPYNGYREWWSNNITCGSIGTNNFNSTNAMFSLGKTEAMNG